MRYYQIIQESEHEDDPDIENDEYWDDDVPYSDKAQNDAKTEAPTAHHVDVDKRAFKNWFGGSKVVDDSGSPLIVYHGTPAMLSADFIFDPNRKGTTTFIGIPVKVQRYGFFFAENKQFADLFAHQGNRVGKVGAFYLSIKNPLRMTESGVYWKDIEALVQQGVDRNWLENHAGDPRSTYEEFDEKDGAFFSNAIQKAGFDGALIQEPNHDSGDPEYVWIAFRPNQIKAVENKGTFDPEDDRIYEHSIDDVLPKLRWSDRGITSGYHKVIADVEKLDGSLQKDRDFYVGQNGEGGIRTRYPDFQKWLKLGIPIEMPRMSLNYRGDAFIGNGRHRFAVLRDMGFKTIPVLVPAKDVREFKNKFGAS